MRTKVMRIIAKPLAVLIVLGLAACSSKAQRGLADKRSDFERFLPMERDPAGEGLKAVEPYFKTANKAQIVHAIERACQGNKAGSSVFDPKTGAGYYVNCNPRNRQLANGYIPLDPSRKPGRTNR